MKYDLGDHRHTFDLVAIGFFRKKHPSEISPDRWLDPYIDHHRFDPGGIGFTSCDLIHDFKEQFFHCEQLKYWVNCLH